MIPFLQILGADRILHTTCTKPVFSQRQANPHSPLLHRLVRLDTCGESNLQRDLFPVGYLWDTRGIRFQRVIGPDGTPCQWPA